jgi:hypothetical protein
MVWPSLGGELEKAELKAILEDKSLDGDAVARAVATAAPRWGALTELVFSVNYWDFGFFALFTSRVNLGDSGAVIVAGALQHLRQLTRLDLSDTGMGVTGALALAPALSHIPLLKELLVYNNILGDEGVCAIAAALPHVPQLIKLDLYGTGMGVTGAHALASALQHIPHLTHLVMRKNPEIDDVGAIALAAGLHCVPKLEKLDVEYCRLSTGWFSSKPGISALKDAIKRSCPSCTLKADDQQHRDMTTPLCSESYRHFPDTFGSRADLPLYVNSGRTLVSLSHKTLLPY